MGTFEQVRQRSYDVLGKIQERLRSDWVHDADGPSHEQILAMDEARRHLAAAKAALAKAAGTPAISPPAAMPPALAPGRFSMRRR